ncbi:MULTISPECIES: hypothetical protein [Deinococcus]|uniref:hypothetical protein n=1 Tax=Deinococcus TaxID=1298 RepID=UPI00385C820E
MTDTPKKRGRPPKHAEASLTEALSLPLPPAEGVVAHRPLSVLEVQESADLDALLLDARLAGLIVARLDPHVALLAQDSEKAVLEALRKAGHLPKVVDG